VADELARALDGLEIQIAGETEHGALIDHIATTDELLCGRLLTWSGKSEAGTLSDQVGVVAELASQLQKIVPVTTDE
jgi:hypothetical protein